MKNFITIQRLLALVLVALLILSIGVCAFAEETENPEPTPSPTPTATASPTPTETPVDPAPTPTATVPPTEDPILPTPTPSPTVTPSNEPAEEDETSPTPAPTEEPAAPILDEPEIPAPAYTLNIPADQTVPYKAESHRLDCPTVSGTSGFAAGKNIRLTVSWTAFTCEAASTAIPFSMMLYSTSGTGCDFASGTAYFIGNEDGTATEYPVGISDSTGEHMPAAYFTLNFNAADWEAAMPGEYKASITFSTEIVEQ